MSKPSWPALFAKLPPLRASDPGQFTIQRLPGLTNHNYRLQGQGVDYVLRLPGANSEQYLDRESECHNLRKAIQLGLAPEWVYADSGSGVLLSRYLAGHSLTPADLREQQHLTKVLNLLRRLHQSKVDFRGRWPLFATLEQNLRWSGSEWQAELTERIKIAEHWRPELEDQTLPLCSCHCDANSANFRLESSGRLWLLDWEYSAQAEPAWDLATLVADAQLDAERLVQSYSGRRDSGLLRRVQLHTAFLHLLAAAWSAAQIGLGHPIREDLPATIRHQLQQAHARFDSL